MVYVSSDLALTYNQGALYNRDTYSVFIRELFRAGGEHVPGRPCDISHVTIRPGTDYAISFTGASFSITPRGLSVTADAQTKIDSAACRERVYTSGAAASVKTNRAVFVVTYRAT